jgi:hypothetical protein
MNLLATLISHSLGPFGGVGIKRSEPDTIKKNGEIVIERQITKQKTIFNK